MKITAQSNIIQAVLDAMEHSIYGIGIAVKCSIEYDLNRYDSFIEITPKDDYELSDQDIFWLGFVSKEYLETTEDN